MSYSNTRASYGYASLFRRACWNLVYFFLFKPSPWFAFSWRNLLLTIFGAYIEKGVRIYPSVKFFNPTLIHLGKNSSLGPRTSLYNHALIKVGFNTVVSQDVMLCTGSHDFRDPSFPLISSPIIIEDNCWICAGCFVGPGVKFSSHSVLGARSVLFKNVDGNQVWAGNPAAIVSRRGRV